MIRFLLLSLSLLRKQVAKWDRKTALTGHSCLSHGMRLLILWPRRAVRRGELPGRENENGNDVDSVVYSVGRCLRATHSLFWLRKLVGRAGVEPAAR